jgi:hypothetical protein
MVVDFALWTKADSVTYFDTISITPSGKSGRKSHGLQHQAASL